MTCDMWHLTYDIWHVPHGIWHMTGDRLEEVKLLSKCQLPSSYGLGVRGDMWHLSCDTWHLTHDIWPVSCDTEGVMSIVSTFQVPSSYGLGAKVFGWQPPSLHRPNFWLNYVWKSNNRHKLFCPSPFSVMHTIPPPGFWKGLDWKALVKVKFP